MHSLTDPQNIVTILTGPVAWHAALTDLLDGRAWEYGTRYIHVADEHEARRRAVVESARTWTLLALGPIEPGDPVELTLEAITYETGGIGTGVRYTTTITQTLIDPYANRIVADPVAVADWVAATLEQDEAESEPVIREHDLADALRAHEAMQARESVAATARAERNYVLRRAIAREGVGGAYRAAKVLGISQTAVAKIRDGA